MGMAEITMAKQNAPDSHRLARHQPSLRDPRTHPITQSGHLGFILGTCFSLSPVTSQHHSYPGPVNLLGVRIPLFFSSSHWPQTHYEVEDGLELLILLPQPPEVCVYKHVLVCSVCTVLEN